MTKYIVYTQTACRQKFYFAIVFFNCLNLWRMKNVQLVMNKPSWPQITAFWRATQLGRKFVFWQQIIAICWVTTHKVHVQFILVLCVSLSLHSQSVIYTVHMGCGQNLGPGPWATLWVTLFWWFYSFTIILSIRFF